MDDNKLTIKLILAFAAVYLIWGSTYYAIKVAIETLPPFLMAGVRFLTAGTILYFFARRRTNEKATIMHWRSSFIIGGFLLLGGNGLVVYAEQFIDSGLAAVLIATEPVWIVILLWLSSKSEKPRLKTVLGVLLGFVGLVYLINPFDTSSTQTNYIGVSAVLIASLSWAVGSIYAKTATQPKSPFLTVSMQMLCGGVLLTIAGLLFDDLNSVNLSAISTRSIIAILYLIIFGSIIAFTSYIWLIGVAGPSKASTYAYVNPVVAIIIGWALGNEIINLRIIIATLIIIFSVAVINTNFRLKFRSIIKR